VAYHFGVLRRPSLILFLCICSLSCGRAEEGRPAAPSPAPAPATVDPLADEYFNEFVRTFSRAAVLGFLRAHIERSYAN
jgi:hypothetical protein